MRAIALRLEHSVEVDVGLEFAWKHRTDPATWNDPPATFVFDGPFVAGARGTTLLPGQPPLRWGIREATPPNFFVVDMSMEGAMLSFEWRFEKVSDRRTRMTQTIVLAGENAAVYAEHIKAGFGSGLADGMSRIASEMSDAARRS